MKIIIFGSTGGTGRELVKLGLENGHVVTAFARDPAKLSDFDDERLSVFHGDVLEPQSVERAVAGHEGVLSAIGAGRAKTTLRHDGTCNIVKAMEKSGVKRLISLSSLGVGDSRSNLPFFLRRIIVPLVLRHVFSDHAHQERVVRQCNLDWIIVRPSYLTDGPLTGIYSHGFPVTERNLKGKISRADVADFMLKQLEDSRYLRQTPGLSY